MLSEHRLLLLTHDGAPLRVIEEFLNLDYVRSLNDVGWFELIVPGDYPKNLLQVDYLIEIWRRPEGGIETLQMVGFLRKWRYFMESDGTNKIKLSGPDQLELLNRATIAYAAGEPESDKTDFADDMLKEIVNENKGPGAGNTAEGRFRGYDANHFSISGDESAAPSLTRRFAWRQMWPVLKEIAESSGHLGTPLFFDCEPMGHGKFEFRTWINLRGIDRTIGTGLAPIVFSIEAGNLIQPSLEEDWTEEWNYVYGGGQGEETSRLIDTENDLSRILRSIWNRREIFQDAREEDEALGVAQKAFQRMNDSRPRLRFEGQLIDSPQARYGVEWGFGDKVTVQYQGRTLNGDINNVHIAYTVGAEEVSAFLGIDIASG